MTVQFEFWHLILLLLAFFGCVAGFGRVLIEQFDKRLTERFAAQDKARTEAAARWDERFNQLQAASQEESRNWHRVERELLKMQAELPREYVRREDHIRFETVINAKLDAINARLDLSNVYNRKD